VGVLTGTDRAAIAARLGAELSARRESVAITKAQAAAAAGATDDWLEAGFAALGARLDTAGAGGLTTAQRWRLAAAIALRKAEG